MNRSAQIIFTEEHPAFAGHFPGTPIVPGVLLLAEALAGLEQGGGVRLRCSRILNAKFLRAVKPGEIVDVEIKPHDPRHSQLRLSAGGALIAEARLEHPAQASNETRHD